MASNICRTDGTEAGVPAERSISVVIPTYNRPEFLREAVESALAQTRKPREIIVVDDFSPVEVASSLKGLPPCVIYHRLPENRGVSGARNKGVQTASSEFVAFLDDDDVWEPTYLEQQLSAIERGAEAVLCGFSFMDTGETVVQSVEWIDESHLRRRNSFCGATGFMARRSALLEEPWDEKLRFGEDWDMYIRLSKRAPLACVPRPLFQRRFGEHDGLVLAAMTAGIKDLEVRATVLHKNRTWLGERDYRRRLAGYLLSYIGKRNNKLEFIRYSIKRAGLVATFEVLLDAVMRNFRKQRI